MLTKALPFITLPIITRLLPDASAYGIADMFNLINSFGTAIAVLGMYDAIFREFFEDKENSEYQKKVTSTGLTIVLCSSIIMILLTLIFNKYITMLLFKNLEYRSLVTLSAFAIGIGGVSSIIAAPTRMRNNRKIYLYTGVSFPILGFVITYSLIKLGYTYEAIVYSNLAMSLTSLITFYILNRKDFIVSMFDKKIMKELFKIGLPLLPTFLIYWVYNSMDRVMINRMLGPTELGIYSVGAKVASISQLVYTAFIGGFSYFKFTTMRESDQVEFNSKIFEYLGIISFMLFIVSQPFIKPVFNQFFIGEYAKGEEIFSYLFLSPLILMLFQVVGSQLLIVKKSGLLTVILGIGGLVNIGLNYIMIKTFGIKGAAFSTVFSYFLSLTLILTVCKKLSLVLISKKIRIILLCIFLLNICLLLNYKYINIFFVGTLVLIILMYFKEIKEKIKC